MAKQCWGLSFLDDVTVLLTCGETSCLHHSWEASWPTRRNGAECIGSEDTHIRHWSLIVLPYTFYNFSCSVYHSTLKTEVADSYWMSVTQRSSCTVQAPTIRINIKCWEYLKNLLTTTGKAKINRAILSKLYVLISLPLITLHFYNNA
jgi:hypothetical protein